MRRHMFRWSPARIIAGAFGSISFIGSILLYLPWGHMPGQSITYVDALYTAVSALCVTGLSIVDTAAVFNPFGQAILAVLIQVGGAWRFYHGSRRTAYAWTKSRDTAKKSDS